MHDKEYFNKVKKFNTRKDYQLDVDTASLFLEYCLLNKKLKELFIVGTGLGVDVPMIKKLKTIQIIGIEPRPIFYERALKVYQKINGKLLNVTLGDFVKNSHGSLHGIFLFMHTINHIPRIELKRLKERIKDSFIIIINPNPSIGKIVGKLDDSVISYLDVKQIHKIFNGKIIYDFFYHSIRLRDKDILLREAILLKMD